MAYLAKVARAEAIAVILNLKGEGYATYVAHNLPTETKWTDGLPSTMLTKAMSDRSTDQATSSVELILSDGRAADTACRAVHEDGLGRLRVRAGVRCWARVGRCAPRCSALRARGGAPPDSEHPALHGR